MRALWNAVAVVSMLILVGCGGGATPAAKVAVDIGVLTYRFVRAYVERRPPVPLTLRQVDPLIRQRTLYRDLIDRKTGDPT